MRTIDRRALQLLAVTLMSSGCTDITGLEFFPPGYDCTTCWTPSAQIVVAPAAVELRLGDSIRVTAIAYRADNTVDAAARITWSLIDSGLVRVGNDGWVHALVPGSTTITAHAPGYGQGGTIATVQSDGTAAPRGIVFHSIAAGSMHTCGIAQGDVAWCWGGGSSGELGIGVGPAERWTPARVVSDERWRSLSPGGSFTCALNDANRASCWGQNWSGQLGSGTYVATAAPVQVQSDESFTSLRAGAVTTCALRDTGRVRCWGVDWARYGNGGESVGQAYPVDGASGHVFTAIDMGLEHGCGLAADGRAFCWGLNANGVLGTGSREPSATPTAVAGAARFTQIAVGSGLTCALDAEGSALCWGKMAENQWLTPTVVNTTERFTTIVAGDVHACGLTTDGRALCWGRNQEGQLGISVSDPSAVPVAVAGDHRFIMITAGGLHSCGLTAAGAAYCWGANYYGQLGHGTRSPTAMPGLVEQ